MLTSISRQFGLMIFSLLSGLITGILFDFYRCIRGFRGSKIITFIQDMLFWILAALVVFLFLLVNQYALIGTYVYVYIGLGLYLYLRFISGYFLRFNHKFSSASCKIARILWNLSIYPINYLVYSLKNKNKNEFIKK